MSEKKVYQPKDATKKYQPKTVTPQQLAEESKEPQPVNQQAKKDQVYNNKPRTQQQNRDKPRNDTAKTEETTRGGGNRRGGAQRNEEREKAKPEQDKNSWVYKFHHQDRPKYDHVVVTADTEVPTLPSKDELIK